MKTQLSNSNEMITCLNGAKSLFYQHIMTSHLFAWFNEIWHQYFNRANLEYYAQLILKSVIKETIGADIELKLLLMFIAGYMAYINVPALGNKLAGALSPFKKINYGLPAIAK